MRSSRRSSISTAMRGIGRMNQLLARRESGPASRPWHALARLVRRRSGLRRPTERRTRHESREPACSPPCSSVHAGIGALRPPLGNPVSPINGSQQGGRIKASSFRAFASRWVKYVFDHRRILDAGNHPHGSRAGPAGPHIDPENWFRTSELRPTPATLPSPLTGRSGLPRDSLVVGNTTLVVT